MGVAGAPQARARRAVSTRSGEPPDWLTATSSTSRRSGRAPYTVSVEGDAIQTLVTTKSGKDVKDLMKIKSLTDTTLVVEDHNGKVSEYKKK